MGVHRMEHPYNQGRLVWSSQARGERVGRENNALLYVLYDTSEAQRV